MEKLTAKEKLESKISALIEKVKEAGSWKKPFKSAIASGLPMNHTTGKHYKGINIFFLWMESIECGYSTNSWLTMKQCNSLGGKICKGEKATTVFFFKLLEIQEQDEFTGDMVDKTIPMLKTYRVFNIDQTTLKPQSLDDGVTINPIPKCEEFFGSIDLCEVRDGIAPYYAVTTDYISMPPINKFIDANSYYVTLAHEYIHSTGHKSRLDRDISNKREAYAYEELIAEIGSCFISAHLQIDADDIQENAKAYLKSWLQFLKDDPKYLWTAMTQATKAYEYILDSTITTSKPLAA